MNKANVFVCLAACVCAWGSCTQRETAFPIGPAEEETMLRQWIDTLSSDSFGGRRPTTPYETLVTDYLAGQLDSLGIAPAFDGSYFQEVQLLDNLCHIDGGSIPYHGHQGDGKLCVPDDFVAWNARTEKRVDLPSVPFVFCGFGIDAPEFCWNDFEGVDVRGKIVLALVNDPGFYDENLFQGRNMTYYGRWICKFEQAEKQGAAGCLVIHTSDAAGYGWNVCSNHVSDELALYNAATGNADRLFVNGWIRDDSCRRLFAAAGLDFDQAFEAAKHPGFQSVELNLHGDIGMDVRSEIRSSRNVGGILRGRDLPDEAVVFSGHWDHLGIGLPDETGDAIYNGATDNASGMAATLLCAAQASQLPQRPRSSLLFLFYTSEESGLFGSAHYCANPVIPMENTRACINFESMAPESLTRDVVVLGGGKTILDEYIVRRAKAQGRYVTFNDDNSDGWFFRSDHFNFVKKGVPAVVIEPGHDFVCPVKAARNDFSAWYHKPGDEYSPDWDLEGSLAHINLMLGVGLDLAE